ncbi:MAG: putative glutamate--cysteine ligase [Prochlorococcus sp. SP3034]|nr:putative glutamate--cysteine ligase [Prochlorococcus sp. SP3034]|tara:strand:- start:27 stop:1145 length:1119 start_codon:yes stop_codon:yes gene_type:complete
MNYRNLLKGFEVELFTGTLSDHVGLSNEIEDHFADFVQEPDNRNVEYITNPDANYKVLYKSLINPRIRLRKWLGLRDLTIIPSSTLCFCHDNKFQRSDLTNAYHQFIESNYGIAIATSSVHINIGINDLNRLFSAIRLVRCEASIYLSLSASSPFINGTYSGNHSQRWIQFPKTPREVPFFKDHLHYINWIEENIKSRKMQNIRHFWSSIRPNGPQRPYELDRLELRICDFVPDIHLLLAITALLELRIITLFENMENLDPLLSSKFSLSELRKICDDNEIKAAKNSLNAELINWQNGKVMLCKDWIQNLLEEISIPAKKFNMHEQLKPIYKVIEAGNKSMQWISKFKSGYSINEIMENEIEEMIKSEEDSI